LCKIKLYDIEFYGVSYSRHNKGIKLFGKKFREVRRKQKLTQSQLSFESGISINQISRIEKGEINTGISTIIILAEVLNVHPKDLFDF
jgi:transcriptional regulator with XRE-family HTH domain